MFFKVGLFCAVILIIWLLYREYITKKQMQETLHIMDDIQKGNLDRRIAIKQDSQLAEILFRINEIVLQQKKEKRQLVQNEKRYRELTTSLSHDIRTPVASLIGYLNAIDDGIADEEEQSIYFKKAIEKSNLVRESIDDLFDWLKIESGEWVYNFEKLDFAELLRENLADWVPRFEARQLAYTIRIPSDAVHAVLDKKAVGRVLDNLFSNTLIHSSASHIFISLTARENKLHLDISDNGIGIPAKDLPFIFQRQYKADTSRSTRGTGLGLSIVSELVKAMKGTISVASPEAKGTTFQIFFKTC